MAKRTPIDFDEVSNTNCRMGCNRDRRLEITEEDICKETQSVLDGLPVRCVREWAYQKIHYLVNYFNIFCTGMKDKWEGNIYYIEICSGPGRCIDRSCGSEFNGSSLCIVQNPAFQYLRKAFYFDYNPLIVDVLNKRFNSKNITTAHAYIGNYYYPKQICDHIINETDGKGLFLIFIDPTDCSVPFELIEVLKQRLNNIDFIVNFPVGTDFNRNISNAINSSDTHKNVIEKYTRFLGSDNFFHDSRLLKSDNLERRNIFREYYLESFRKIGYKHFDSKKVKNLYDLVFASSHEKGIEFWEKANRTEFDGQRRLLFE